MDQTLAIYQETIKTNLYLSQITLQGLLLSFFVIKMDFQVKESSLFSIKGKVFTLKDSNLRTVTRVYFHKTGKFCL